MSVPPEASGAAALAVEQEQPWLRLDKRMLLVHPVNETVKLLPVLLVSLVVGSQSGNHLWTVAAIGLMVAVGLLRWLTTSYRVGPVHVQLRRGLLHRRVLSVPRNRIRSVDVEAHVLHRLLGLSVVRIGTGHRARNGPDSNRFELNALESSLVPGLRAALLARHPDVSAEGVPASQAAAGEVEIGHWSPSWVRYAPFSATGILTIAAVVGVVFQSGFGEQVTRSSAMSRSVDTVARLDPVLAVSGGAVPLLVATSVLACIRYLVVYGNLRVTDTGKVLHVSHGLLKTRQTTLDRARLRGASLKEPLLLRLVGGAKVDAVMTGVSAAKGESSLLLPQGPRAEAERVMSAVLGDARQSSVPLVRHGAAARRRRYTRALIPVTVAVLVLAVATLAGRPVPSTAWIVPLVLAGCGVGLAWDRYRGLGHAVLPGWLITRGGSLARSRDSIEADGIIGWTVRQTFFQRRSGVATVIAATPAGTGRYAVLDLPADDAWKLVEAVTPGAGDVWYRPGP